MKALYLTSHTTDIQDLIVDLSEKKVPEIKEDECLVRVFSAGINPSDVLAASGYFKHAVLPRIPGRDFAGTVVKGPDHLIGKKVWGTGGDAGIGSDGTHAEYLKLHIDQLSEIPHNMDLVIAGGQTLPYVTAYYALVSRAEIKPSESVLVVGALGQVGRAAMSILKWKKCFPIALVRGEEQVAQASKLGWIAVNSEESDLAQKIRISSQGASLNVILNSVGNLYWSTFTSVLADFGRIVTIGARENAREAVVNLFDLYRANQELLGINTVHLNFSESALILNALKPGFESGDLQPLPVEKDAIFPSEQATLAYREVLKGSKRRVVIQFN